MSLLGQLRSGIDQAWEALGDLLVEIDYQRVSRGQYNPATGLVAQTTTKVRLKAALVDYTAQERSGSDMESRDRRAILRAKDLPFKADSGDLLVELDGTQWAVQQVAGDARVYWDLKIRR
jgi:hypothetical protein